MISTPPIVDFGSPCPSQDRISPLSPPRRGPLQKTLPGFILLFLFAMLCAPLRAQTIDDGAMLPKHTLFAGTVYSHDSWNQYWEGSLKRANGNIGTITTQTVTYSADFALFDRLDVIAMVPYVWTHPSQGVLSGMSGFQDFTLAGKYRLLETPFTKVGSLKAIAVVAGSIPLTRYTPDFQPLSIGLGSKRIAGRFTVNFQANRGWFLNGSAAYTWRADVSLDRPYYFTENQLFLTNVVAMPNVFDYSASVGYLKHGLTVQASFSQQRTQGGGDIRRQDMPFVSNRMNFSKVGGMVMYPVPLPYLRDLCAQFTFDYVVDGRNVGQSTTFSTGLFYRFKVFGRHTR